MDSRLRGNDELERGGGAGALVYGALGVELGGHIRPADQAHRHASFLQVIEQFAARFLAGAHHDGVDVEHL